MNFPSESVCAMAPVFGMRHLDVRNARAALVLYDAGDDAHALRAGDRRGHQEGKRGHVGRGRRERTARPDPVRHGS